MSADVDLREDEGLSSGAAPIEVRGLVTRFGSQVVHDGVDLLVRPGEILGVVGGSGSGKSVLMNTIMGLKRPDKGQVLIFGQDMAEASREQWADFKRRSGVLFQSSALFSNLNVRQNVMTPMIEHAELGKAEMRRLADLKLALVGLPPEAATKQPAELSGGMKKRAGLARALALDPDILFLDEPTSGLDPVGAAAFDKLIRDLSDSLGLTVFMITHDIDSLYAICDRIAVLADKKIVAVDRVEKLESSDHPWVQEYFLGPRGRAREAQSARSAHGA